METTRRPVSGLRLLLDTQGIEFEVGMNPEPKTDDKGVQKVDSATGWPVWSVQLLARTLQDGVSVVMVSVASAMRPELSMRQIVEPVRLEALPWTNERNGKFRHGIAFRAAELRPATGSGLKPVKAA